MAKRYEVSRKEFAKRFDSVDYKNYSSVVKWVTAIQEIHKDTSVTNYRQFYNRYRNDFFKHVVFKSVRNYDKAKPDVVISDNKVNGEIHWRKWMDYAENTKTLRAETSSNQDYATWEIKTNEPIHVLCFGDQQIGSWGTDYKMFLEMTDVILNTPNLYVFLLGDILQMSIKMRSVIEVMDNLIPPKQQIQILDSWLSEIQHKVICAVWCNHATIREENVLGWSPTADILSKRVIYHNHIGHLDLKVNEQTYKIALSHFFTGRSMLNACHAPMRYLRMTAHDRDIAIQGDFHVPGISKYTEGGRTKGAVVCGSIQTDSGYAKRFFNLKTFPFMPVIRFQHDRFDFTPFLTYHEALNINSMDL